MMILTQPPPSLLHDVILFAVIFMEVVTYQYSLYNFLLSVSMVGVAETVSLLRYFFWVV